MTLAYITQDNYSLTEVKTAIERGIGLLGGFQDILGGRKSILLKPNFVRVDTAESGAITHPDFILAVAELLLDQGCTVSVGDSPGFGSLLACVKRLGLEKEFKKRGISLCPFKRSEEIPGIPDGKTKVEKIFSRLIIARELKKFDGIINLPKMKTHCQLGFSGATKNLYGCVPGKRKAWRHLASGNDEKAFAKMIIRTAEAVSPFFHIADGIESLHVRGPTKGVPFPLNSIFLGKNAYAIDWLFCQLTHFDPMQSQLFQVLGKQPAIEIVGDQPVYHTTFIHSKRIPVSFDPVRVARSMLTHQFVLLRERILRR